MKIIWKSFLQIIIYTFVLIVASILFDNIIYIDTTYYGFWALLASIIIFIINKTIKPYIFKITIPITALTYGLFYPLINVFIFYFTSLILGSHFEIKNIWLGIIIVIIISILKHLLNSIIIEPITRRE